MRKAFKEWAVVCEALGSGRQSLILRKGGIAEPGGRFRPEFDEFLLFPTYAHQSAEGLKPEMRTALDRTVEKRPDPKFVVFEHFAEVRDAVEVDSLERLGALRDLHVWSDAIVAERFRRWKEKLVYALVVRVFRMSPPVSIDYKESYGGCTSWVDLAEDVPAAGGAPVLDDETFERMLRKIRAALGAE